MMFRNTSTAIATILLIIAGTTAAQAAPHYSRAELRTMMVQAHTPQQYRALADYFRLRQQHFEQKAESEKQEWERRSLNTSSLAAKYPEPAASSRNRYQYFAYEAAQMSTLAARYDSLAAGTQPSTNH